MQREPKHLISIPFITCLFLLLINDFWFKEQYQNWVTGKLSDFCGLFVFSIFWSVVFPRKKLFVFISTALLFILWKSPYSNAFITAFSDSLYPIERVVDLSDLLALAVLPIAWRFLHMQLTPTYFSPALMAVLTLFSFCATSIARSTQHFDQPQYILFQTWEMQWHAGQFEGASEVFKQGDLLAVKVNELDLEKRPAKEDDFQKNLVLKDIDKRILSNLNRDERSPLKTPIGKHKLIFEIGDYKDIASFSGSRLDGKFQRVKSDGSTWIDGWYKNGLEDSTWTIRDTTSNKVFKKTFVNGETVRTEVFEDGKFLSSESLNTRKETVRNKYFHLAFMAVLAFGLMILILKNFKATYPQELQLSIWYKLILTFTLPLGILFLHSLFSQAIPDSYSAPFEFFGDAFLIYICSVPLFLLVFLVIRIRKSIDFLWYSLLFATLYTIWQEIMQLERLTSVLLQ